MCSNSCSSHELDDIKRAQTVFAVLLLQFFPCPRTPVAVCVFLICVLTCDPGPFLTSLLPDLLHLLALYCLYECFCALIGYLLFSRPGWVCPRV